MSRYLSVLLGWAVLAAAASAQDGKVPVKSTATLSADRAKLRDFLEMPRGSLFIPFGQMASPTGNILDRESKATPAEQIAGLRKQLTGTDSDAEIYAKLIDLLEDEKECRSVCRKAAELFAKRVAQDRQNAWLWAQYSYALLVMDKVDAAEKAALKATRLAPKDWRCWQKLGLLRQNQAYRTLWGPEKLPWADHGIEQLVVQAQKRNAPRADLDKAEEFLRKAGKCFDREVAAAPEEPEVYWDRIGHHWQAVILREALPGLSGDAGAKIADFRLPPDILRDARKLARLCPANAEVQGFLAGVAFESGMLQIADKLKDLVQPEPIADGLKDHALARMDSPLEEFKCIFDKLPGEHQEIIREATARLAKHAEDKDFTENASRSLTLCSVMQGDLKTALECARRLTQSGPKDEMNWDILEMVLLGKAIQELRDVKADELDARGNEAMRQLIAVSEERLKQAPSGRNSLLLAQMHVYAGNYVQAERVLRAALRVDAGDVRCRIGLAVALMRKGDQASELAEALACLEQVYARIDEMRDMDLRTNFFEAYGVCLALCGRVRQAKEYLEHDLPQRPDDERLKAMLQCFSR